MNLNSKSFSEKAGLAGGALSLVSLIAFCIYGITYSQYFDITVAACFLLGALCSAVYGVSDSKAAEYGPLAGVFFAGFGLGLFFLNSYEVWADWWGGFDMYGSAGGIAPVITIMVITFLSAICDIIACFTVREKEVPVK